MASLDLDRNLLAVLLALFSVHDFGGSPAQDLTLVALLNLVEATEFAVDPLLELMTRRVQDDIGVGIDETSCRMLLPKVDPVLDPNDPKSVRLDEKIREARARRRCFPRATLGKR